MAGALRITEWPQEPLRLRHGFASERPVQIALRDGPLAVRLGTGGEPMRVSLATVLRARRSLPLCLGLCEALCLSSDYTVGITVFDRVVASVRVRGTTRLFSEGGP